MPDCKGCGYYTCPCCPYEECPKCKRVSNAKSFRELGEIQRCRSLAYAHAMGTLFYRSELLSKIGKSRFKRLDLKATKECRSLVDVVRNEIIRTKNRLLK